MLFTYIAKYMCCVYAMAGDGTLSFLFAANGMFGAILRTVLLYGIFSSLTRYFFPTIFSGKVAAMDDTASEQVAEVLAEDLVEDKKEAGRDELRRIFSTFDKNGDGLISKQEMTDSLEKLGLRVGDDDVSSSITDVDANGDGHVDFEEFVLFYRSVCGRQQTDNLAEDPDLAEAFAVFDCNGDGLITVEELQSVLRSLGLKEGGTVGDCRTMIQSVDVDGDGMVNYAEFKKMMSTAKELKIN